MKMSSTFSESLGCDGQESLDSDVLLASSNDDESTCDTIINQIAQWKVQEQEIDKMIDQGDKLKENGLDFGTVYTVPTFITATNSMKNESTAVASKALNTSDDVSEQKKQTCNSSTNTSGRYYRHTNYRYTRTCRRYNAQPYQLPFHSHRINQYSGNNYYSQQHYNGYSSYKPYQSPQNFYNHWKHQTFERQQYYKRRLFRGFNLFTKFMEMMYNLGY